MPVDHCWSHGTDGDGGFQCLGGAVYALSGVDRDNPAGTPGLLARESVPECDESLSRRIQRQQLSARLSIGNMQPGSAPIERHEFPDIRAHCGAGQGSFGGSRLAWTKNSGSDSKSPTHPACCA